jgi:hypothetical protein
MKNSDIRIKPDHVKSLKSHLRTWHDGYEWSFVEVEGDAYWHLRCESSIHWIALAFVKGRESVGRAIAIAVIVGCLVGCGTVRGVITGVELTGAGIIQDLRGAVDGIDRADMEGGVGR